MEGQEWEKKGYDTLQFIDSGFFPNSQSSECMASAHTAQTAESRQENLKAGYKAGSENIAGDSVYWIEMVNGNGRL